MCPSYTRKHGYVPELYAPWCFLTLLSFILLSAWMVCAFVCVYKLCDWRISMPQSLWSAFHARWLTTFYAPQICGLIHARTIHVSLKLHVRIVSAQQSNMSASVYVPTRDPAIPHAAHTRSWFSTRISCYSWCAQSHSVHFSCYFSFHK